MVAGHVESLDDMKLSVLEKYALGRSFRQDPLPILEVPAMLVKRLSLLPSLMRKRSGTGSACWQVQQIVNWDNWKELVLAMDLPKWNSWRSYTSSSKKSGAAIAPDQNSGTQSLGPKFVHFSGQL